MIADNEAVYDAEVAPLMTALPRAGQSEASSAAYRAVTVSLHRASPFQITTKAPDGSNAIIEVVLP